MKKHPPFIGITCDVLVVKNRENEYELLCDHRYAEAVKEAGGFPLLVPIASRPLIIQKILNEMDGLVIVGGDDVDPELYGEKKKKGTGTVFPKRFSFEKKLYYEARKRKMPILGICYGMQLINVLEGGTLFQDIKRDAKSNLSHQNFNSPIQRIRIESGSRLHKILVKKFISAHCEHHQAVCRVASGFRPVAFARDGIIEAIEGTGRKEIFAVQWHPERMLRSSTTKRLMRSFIRSVGI